MKTSVRITDAFSEKINDLAASSTRVPGVLPSISVLLASIPDNSNITGSLIHENRVQVLPASAQTTTPSANVANHNAPLVSAIRDVISNTCNRSESNSMANSSGLPSESAGTVASGNHDSTTAAEKSAPMPGAAKKSSKMRPGTTNTARCDCG
jgi:hypothetical protein